MVPQDAGPPQSEQRALVSLVVRRGQPHPAGVQKACQSCPEEEPTVSQQGRRLRRQSACSGGAPR